MSITNKLNQIKNAIYGKEVRGAIHDAIKECYDDASVNHDNANMEVKMARGTHNTLNDRLDKSDEIQVQTNAQLSVSKKELSNKIQEVASTGTTTEVLKATTEKYMQEKIDDGTIANLKIEDNSVSGNKLTNGSISLSKIANNNAVTLNLFDVNNMIYGGYIDANNGKVVIGTSAGGYDCYLDYTVVEPDTNYYTPSSHLASTIYYDKDKNYLGKSGIINNFTTPYNCVYVRINLKTQNDKSKMYLSKIRVHTPYKAKINELTFSNDDEIKLLKSGSLYACDSTDFTYGTLNANNPYVPIDEILKIRISNTEFIKILKGVVVRKKTTIKLAVLKYDLNFNFIENLGFTYFSSNSEWISDGDYYIRVVVAKADDTVINADEVEMLINGFIILSKKDQQMLSEYSMDDVRQTIFSWSKLFDYPNGLDADNRPSSKRIVGHRGYSSKYPENTMLAFKECYNTGAIAFETDVRVSSDGKFVLMHDTTLDRTTSASGDIRNKTFAELITLDAGGWKGASFANREDTKIPSLEEMLDFVKSNAGKYVYLHLSSNITESEAIEVLNLVVEKNMIDQVVFFSDSHCVKIRELNGNAYTLGWGMSTLDNIRDQLNRAKKYKINAVGLDGGSYNKFLINSVHNENKDVFISWIDNNFNARVRNALSLHANHILIDNPEEGMNVFDEQGVTQK